MNAPSQGLSLRETLAKQPQDLPPSKPKAEEKEAIKTPLDSEKEKEKEKERKGEEKVKSEEKTGGFEKPSFPKPGVAPPKRIPRPSKVLCSLSALSYSSSSSFLSIASTKQNAC